MTPRDTAIRQLSVAGFDLQFQGSNHQAPEYDDAWTASLLKHSQTFVDVGCNVGFFAALFCALQPEGQVVAIDANREAAACAAGNLVRNGFGMRATVGTFFVSDREGTTDFFTVGLGAAGSSRADLASTAAAVGGVTRVPTKTLDAVLRELGTAPDLVKVDVEGAEQEVLWGAAEIAQSAKPRWIVEMHSGPSLPMSDNAAEVLRWCEAFEYNAWYLKRGVRLESPDLIASRGRCHLLLVARGEEYPRFLEGVPQGAAIESVL